MPNRGAVPHGRSSDANPDRLSPTARRRGASATAPFPGVAREAPLVPATRGRREPPARSTERCQSGHTPPHAPPHGSRAPRSGFPEPRPLACRAPEQDRKASGQPLRPLRGANDLLLERLGDLARIHRIHERPGGHSLQRHTLDTGHLPPAGKQHDVRARTSKRPIKNRCPSRETVSFVPGGRSATATCPGRNSR